MLRALRPLTRYAFLLPVTVSSPQLSVRSACTRMHLPSSLTSLHRPRKMTTAAASAHAPLKEAGDSMMIRPPPTVRRLPAAPVSVTRFADGKKVHMSAQDREALDSFAKTLKLDDYKSDFRTALEFAALTVPPQVVGQFRRDPQLNGHVLRIPRVNSVVSRPNEPERRLLLKYRSADELPDDLKELAQSNGWEVTHHTVEVDYSYFSADDVIRSLLPESMPEGTPTAYTSTGHIAHVNLRDDYLPYRFVIGQVLLEKNASVSTVVNKLDNIDTKFRFFAMELIAGEPRYDVELSESNCSFRFDFRKVYWNSRLSTEHSRLVSLFSPYDVVSDVMAGVGPFAIPAAKRRCWVLANDLNPASYASLEENRVRNHVEQHCIASCEDGRAFIRNSILRTWNTGFPGKPLGGADSSPLSRRQQQRAERAQRQQRVALKSEHPGDDTHPGSKAPGTGPSPAAPSQAEPPRGRRRRLIDHFVMNLPGSALEFLDAFRGAYRVIPDRAALEAEIAARREDEHERKGGEWPMVHVHCFTKETERPYEDICKRANAALGLEDGHPAALRPPPRGQSGGQATEQGVSFHLVRSVAPNKDMYCLSFPLSAAILLDLPLLDLDQRAQEDTQAAMDSDGED